MTGDTRSIQGIEVPSFLYGTAWKEERTASLVHDALAAGFRGIDTANQRKHYFEAGVGDALTRAFDEGGLTREEVFLQTKFTYVMGQDHRLPYDPRAPVAEQVSQSFASSLGHLRVHTIDSLVLHGPSQARGLGDADREAWRAMETLQESGRVRLLGISNVRPDQLEELIASSRVTPAFVQNRCFARLGWDAPVRDLCARHDIVYQGFSLLTANPEVLGDPAVRAIAAGHERTVPQVIFRFALQLGMLPLTGTTDPGHMRDDLAAHDFTLEDAEVQTLLKAGLRR